MLFPPAAAGNESPVTAYMKSAGLMFENREAFGALVLFIEVWVVAETHTSWAVAASVSTVTADSLASCLRMHDWGV